MRSRSRSEVVLTGDDRDAVALEIESRKHLVFGALRVNTEIVDQPRSLVLIEEVRKGHRLNRVRMPLRRVFAWRSPAEIPLDLVESSGSAVSLNSRVCPVLDQTHSWEIRHDRLAWSLPVVPRAGWLRQDSAPAEAGLQEVGVAEIDPVGRPELDEEALVLNPSLG